MTARQLAPAVAVLVVLAAVVAFAAVSFGRRAAWCPAPVSARPAVLAVPSADAPVWLGGSRPWAPVAPPPVGDLAVLAQAPVG